MKKTSKEITCPFCKHAISDLTVTICEKCKHFINAEKVTINEKVVYIPSRDSMIKGITDNAYEYFRFYPCDVFTIKGTEIDERKFKYILVRENGVRFSPHEFIPENEIREDLKMSVINEYKALVKKYGQ